MNRTNREVGRDLLYGFGGGLLSYQTSVLTIGTCRYVFEKWNLPFDQNLLSKNFDWIYSSINAIQHYLIRGACKTLFVAYLVIVGPIFEEWAFRNALYTCQEGCQLPIERVLCNAIAFGAVHFNYFHGIGSIAYFLVATIAGVVYASLREWTKNWHVSALAHGVGNAYVVALEIMR